MSDEQISNQQRELASIIGEQFQHQAPQAACTACPDIRRAAAAVMDWVNLRLADAWDEGHDGAATEMAKYENPYRTAK